MSDNYAKEFRAIVEEVGYLYPATSICWLNSKKVVIFPEIMVCLTNHNNGKISIDGLKHGSHSMFDIDRLNDIYMVIGVYSTPVDIIYKK